MVARGAAGAVDFGTGGGAANTFPGAVLPFGMLAWSPDSTPSLVNAGGGYSYSDQRLRGFSLTHLSGAGCAQYADIPFRPTSAPLSGSPVAAGSGGWDPSLVPSFSRADEVAQPGYYRVRLDPGTPAAIQAELTATTRTGLARFTYPATSGATVLNQRRGQRDAEQRCQRADRRGAPRGDRIVGERKVLLSAKQLSRVLRRSL